MARVQKPGRRGEERPDLSVPSQQDILPTVGNPAASAEPDSAASIPFAGLGGVPGKPGRAMGDGSTPLRTCAR